MSGRSIRIDDNAPARAARSIVRRLAAAVRAHGNATLAVSGGSTAPPLLAELARADLPWDDIGVWQVDERVAPDGDPDRNANQLAGLPGTHHLMPVTAADLDRAATLYAKTLPQRFDAVHLGMGPDGHTASWPPGDPVIDSDLPVALSGEFNGRVRMTLTPGVINAARGRVVLITGDDKAKPVAAWLEGHGDDLPIARVRRSDTVVVLDPAAASDI
jgi:6-phosphogluconolactonase/glucosamine-6-phosphate isomerase/deaminase